MGRAVQMMLAAGAILLLSSFFCGCGATGEVAPPHQEGNAGTDLRTVEKEFRPSDYGREAEGKRTGGNAPAGEDQEVADTATVTTALEELAQGFRVQVFSTTDIDIAKSRMTEAETAFPAEWFYLRYDPPVYKIRAGNFLNRLDAERFMQSAQERGFRGAWVVPEKVISNPPPPPPREIPQTPK